MEKSKKNRIYCAVPNCTVTNTKNPEKIFFTSPMDPKMRKKWLLAMRRRISDLSPNTQFRVCEDHFNLENDLKNYTAYKLSTQKSGRHLKADAVPSIFKCQTDKVEEVDEREFPKTKKRKALVAECISSSRNISVETIVEDKNITVDTIIKDNESRKYLIDKSAQCCMRMPHRSKGIQCSIGVASSCSTADEFPTSIQNERKEEMNIDDVNIEESSSSITLISSASKISEDSHNYSICSDWLLPDEEKQDYYIKHSREYTGIPSGCLHIVDKISNLTGIDIRNIFIVLMKIRKNYTFSELSHRFNLTEQTIMQIFSNSITKISETMKHFIQRPSPLQIKYSLPISFRLNFSKVQSIIDCLEIEIQKPTDPVLQALTWSDYKKGNTIKYLVECTPHGMITYISPGFGGRTSDMEIVKRSGYLDQLPDSPGIFIMADRGFKGIDTILQEKGCTLIRPPSVTSGEKLSKADTHLTKQIASLRIHVERAIRRIREFKFLSLHSSVHSHLVKYLDDSILIACGIINLQPSLIKSE